MKDYRTTKENMRDFKYPLGTIVVRSGENGHFDNVFGVNKNDIGVIVGYDTEYDYYRVYFSERNPFIGVRECRLSKYDDSITFDIFDISQRVQMDYDFKLALFTKNNSTSYLYFLNCPDILGNIQEEIDAICTSEVDKWVLYKRTSLLSDQEVLSSSDIDW